MAKLGFAELEKGEGKENLDGVRQRWHG